MKDMIQHLQRTVSAISCLLALITVLAMLPFGAQASQQTNALAKTVNGIVIPIVVMTPETGTGPFPVVFHVHGGGWNGGTDKVVPPAAVGQSASVLCDELGIVFVGLSYRCKNQQGTFQLAMSDLHDSVDWFSARAETFKADLTRVGFSGGSAGTPLSALMAQQTPACRTYVGCWGVYDFTNNKESLFPDEQARASYALADRKQVREASAFHNLRKPPPATLLLHGGKDILTHPAQSIRFGRHIEANGGSAEVIIFPDQNHNFMSPTNPEAYKESLLAIARFYDKGFELRGCDLARLEKKLDAMLVRMFPSDSIADAQLLGTWEGRTETLSLQAKGKAETITKHGKMASARYKNEKSSFEVSSTQGTRTFYLRRDGRVIYYVHPEGRHAGKKELFTKRK